MFSIHDFVVLVRTGTSAAGYLDIIILVDGTITVTIGNARVNLMPVVESSGAAANEETVFLTVFLGDEAESFYH